MFVQEKQNSQSQRFLNPEALLSSVPVVSGMKVADFGCGNGYYSVAAGAMVGQKGEIFAIDIMDDALSQTSTLAKIAGLRNINTKQCDLDKFGTCDVPETSCDLVIMASLLHQLDNKDNAVKEAYRLLRTGGKILVVEWKPDAKFGPISKDRLEMKEIQSLLEKHGFRPITNLPAGDFHNAVLYQK